jgi:4-hydroxybenzoyl-CoA reductase subunit beta
MTAPLPDLQLTRPLNAVEAVAARHRFPDSEFIAGGTDLLVSMRHGIRKPETLIDLSEIDELNHIEVGDAGAYIGAGLTIAKLGGHSVIRTAYRAVADACEQIAGPSHRVVGTVGGNLCLDTRCIYYNQSEWWRSANGYCLKHRGDSCHVAPQGQRCHASFTGDLAPALLVLAAEIEIINSLGRRRVPLSELYAEDGRAHLRLAKDDLLVAVRLPPSPSASAYAKIRVRGSIDYPLAGVAVALAGSGGAITSLRIGITGTNSRPFVVVGTDELVGRPIDQQALHKIDRLVQKQVQPMRTTVASAQYRRLAAAALACRLTKMLFERHCQDSITR